MVLQEGSERRARGQDPGSWPPAGREKRADCSSGGQGVVPGPVTQWWWPQLWQRQPTHWVADEELQRLSGDGLWERCGLLRGKGQGSELGLQIGLR